MKKRMLFLGLLLASVSSSWAEEADQGLVEVECTFTRMDRSKVRPGQADSIYLNWSGYAAFNESSKQKDSVSLVSGSWVIPTLLPTNNDTYSLIFVGIDGYNNGTVEQIGTGHNWYNGAQQNFAWFEMYPAGLYTINNFPVDNGDIVSAKSAYKGNGVFKLMISNLTKGVTTTIPQEYTTSTSAERATAEWIVEAPYNDGILPLSNFQKVTWNYCSATISGVTGAINDGAWFNDAITMEKNNVVESVPSDLLKGGTCFQMTWHAE